MNRILVTGATGFLGRATIAALAAGGQRVRAAMRRPQLVEFGQGVEIVEHPDLAGPFDWRPLLEGVDQIVHLAGIAHTGPGIAADLYDRVNRLATERLVAAAAQTGVGRFVFVSSIRAQSGPAADHALSERDVPTATDVYGRSKLAAEAAVRAAGAPFTILRPALVYGPGVKGNFGSLLRAALSPWPLPAKPFTGRRSLLDIDNFVSALAFVLGADAAKNETYVLADPGEALGLADMIATLRKACGRRPLLLPVPASFVELPLRLMRRSDVWERFGGDLRVDPGKLIAAGWRPQRDTRAGLTALARTIMAKKSPARR